MNSRRCERRPFPIRAAIAATLAGAFGGLLSPLVAQVLSDAPRDAEEQTERIREGTQLVNVPGVFKLTGDRATFYPADHSGRYGGLENQTLERVALVIGEDPSPMEWLVSGTITEFRGNNYILVTRAILKSKLATMDQAAQSLQRNRRGR